MNFELTAANLKFIHNETYIQEQKMQKIKNSKKLKKHHNQY